MAVQTVAATVAKLELLWAVWWVAALVVAKVVLMAVVSVDAKAALWVDARVALMADCSAVY